MDARVTDIRYRVGFEPVTVTVVTPYGVQRVQTTQATLTARAGGGPWGDEQVLSVAQDALDALQASTFSLGEQKKGLV